MSYNSNNWKAYKKKHEVLCKFYAYSDKYRDPNYLYVWKVTSLDEAERLARMFKAKGRTFWYDGVRYYF